MKLIFIGGVHGVGKSTTCAEAARRAGALHVAASELIRSERSGAVSEHGKQIADLRGNQQLLVDGFRRYCLAHRPRGVLLDGHFTLQVEGAGVKPVPIEVFVELDPQLLVCLVDEADRIAARLHARDKLASVEDEVNALQAIERAQARALSGHLGIPLVEVRAFDVDSLAKLIGK